MSKRWKQMDCGNSKATAGDGSFYCDRLDAWLAPVELPETSGWPAPRDTKTDPPPAKTASEIAWENSTDCPDGQKAAFMSGWNARDAGGGGK